MKTKFMYERLTRTGLIIILACHFLFIPIQPAAAKPLADPFTNCAAQTQIPETECNALVALYTSTNGVNWVNHTDWLQTDTPCTWFGVTCDNGTNVTELWLKGNNLSGAIPAQLGNLSHLTILESSHSNLSGSIPAQLGNLSNLTKLYLFDNALSGPIPPELGNLINLTTLALSDNGLSGSIPTEMGNLINLTSLWLDNNALSGSIPTALGNLTNLTTISLRNNQLSGEIPTSVLNLVNLQGFVFDCDLTSSDPDVMAFLDIVSPDWRCLPRFVYVSPDNGLSAGGTTVVITAARVTGASAVTFGGINATSFTVDSASQITAISPAHAQGIVDISITTPKGTGTEPNAFTYSSPFTTCASVMQISEAECNILVALYTSTDGANWANNTNWLQTNLPCRWHGVICSGGTSVTGLDLGSNNLSGAIPSALGGLTNLTTLYLYNNALTGPIPPELESLTNLTTLYLFGNALSGSIPTELGNLTNLRTLSLIGNALSGEFPDSITNLVNLTSFSFDCELTSSDPSVIVFIDTVEPGWRNRTCPALASPLDSAALDNGRTDKLDDIVWDFDWSDVPSATNYQLYVTRQGAANPTIDLSNIVTSSYHYVNLNNYISSPNRFNWEWKTRAYINGFWGEWSEVRSFSVEPPNSDAAQALAKNGGFNVYIGTSRIPKFWQAVHFATTDGKTTSIKKEGAASVKVSGSMGVVKTLSQTLNVSGPAGDLFIFSYWIKGSAVPAAGICQAKVSFYNGAILKGAKVLKCPIAITYNFKKMTLNFAAPAAYNKIVITFTYSKPGGTVWFDGVSLMR